MEKSALRQKMFQYLHKLTKEERNELETQLHAHLFTCAAWKKARTIGMTASKFPEWNTYPLLKCAWEENKTVCLPKTYANKKELIFFAINEKSTFVKGYGDILEPDERVERRVDKSEIDLIIVPGVVFDRRGFRIGFGGGYYDRFLQDFPNLTLSLCSEKQLVNEIPNESYDIPVQWIITEKGCFQV